MTSELIVWALRNGVSDRALTELLELIGAPLEVGMWEQSIETESAFVNLVRLEVSNKLKGRVWRNNVGSATPKGSKRPIRFGLANDSHALNAVLKSSDLIGIRPTLITREMVGTTVGQFLSFECKEPGWKYTGKGRELAQYKWITLINSLGGYAKFVNGGGQI